METITDPRGTGWVDSSGSENGDNGMVQCRLHREHQLANRSGQLGCIY